MLPDGKHWTLIRCMGISTHSPMRAGVVHVELNGLPPLVLPPTVFSHASLVSHRIMLRVLRAQLSWSYTSPGSQLHTSFLCMYGLYIHSVGYRDAARGGAIAILIRRDYESAHTYIYAAPHARYCGALIATARGRPSPAYC
jgi:hypothetical protein